MKLRTSPRPRRSGVLTIAVALLAALLFATHPGWLPLVGRFLVVHDEVAHAEAVVPLAGDPERAVHAAELVAAGRARLFVITPLPLPRATEAAAYLRQIRSIARAYGVPDGSILEVPRTADSTYGEAMNVRRFAEEHGIGSLIVTTSPWHTRRSKIIFDEVFRDASVTTRVVPLPEHVYALPARVYRPERWWTSRSGRRNTASEYLKLVAHGLGIR